MLSLVLMLAMRGTIGMAQEFSIKGTKATAQVGSFRFDLTGVTLEESNQGAAINLSMQLTDVKGTTEKLYLTVPASSRTGNVQSRYGTISLKRVEGLDQYFYNSPEKIIWWFEFLPDSAQKLKTHIYMIDGKQVTDQAYQELLKTLTGQERWYCAETRNGGETGWESKDSPGHRYKVVTKSDTTDISSITRISELAP
jgi:hypothetical protein